MKTKCLAPVNAIGPPALLLLADRLLLPAFAAHFDDAPADLRALDAAPDVDLRTDETALLRAPLLRLTGVVADAGMGKRLG